MSVSRLLMLGLVAVMLLGVLALVVWVFRVVVQTARGITQTLGASPKEPLEALGFAVTHDVAGGMGQGHWKGTAVQVGWRMTAAPFAGDHTPPPAFTTTVSAFFSQPLALGISVHEETGAPACGIAGLDGRLRLGAAPSPHGHDRLTQGAADILRALDAPGRLQITDQRVSIHFEEIVGEQARLREALEHVTTLHAALQGHG